MDMRDCVEIELTNGKKILLDNRWEKAYGICEKSYYKISFLRKFPFVHLNKHSCTKFRFRTQYETMNDFFDDRYKANCTVRQLATLFGASVVPFEETCIEGDLNQ